VFTIVSENEPKRFGVLPEPDGPAMRPVSMGPEGAAPLEVPPPQTLDADPGPYESGEVQRQLAGVPRRPPAPLYRPGWAARTFGWAGDLVARLDPAPLGRAFQSATRPLDEAFGRMMEIPARWLEAFTRKGPIGHVWSDVDLGIGLTLVPVARGMERMGRALSHRHERFARQVEKALARLPLPGWLKEVLWLAPAARGAKAGSTVQARMKELYDSVAWASVTLSVAVHMLAFGYAPQFHAEDFSFQPTELMAVEIPPEVEIPPPPRAIMRPATPVISSVPLDEDITIAPTTFADNPVDALPPPPAPRSSGDPGDPDIASAPTFTPFTVAPEIRNREEIIQLISAVYPPDLRDAGVGGVVVVWFYIEEGGRVASTRVAQSSGFAPLDAAALQVSDRFVFSPALLNDQFVPVWVQFPITFQVR
jgi:periplasmic protein TonB